MVAGLVSARSWGFGRRAAANVALTILGRGEFSLILATLAAAAGLDPRLGPFVALYVLVLAIAGPLLASHPTAMARLLPGRLFAARSGAQSLIARPGTEPASLRPAASRRIIWKPARPSGAASDRVPRRLRRILQMPLGRLVVPAVCLAAVLVYGAAGYLVLGYSLGEALWMTWSDISPAEALGPMRPEAARFFGLTVTAFGLLSLFVGVVTAVGIAIEGGFGFSWRRRRMQQRIDRLVGHFIICAYGRVGRAVAREFEAEGVPFVVIDAKDELEERMRSDGVFYLIADPTSEAVLRRAGIERARGLLCAVDSDATNLYVTLTARALNPGIFITGRAGEAESPERLYRAGANRVISPYVTSGRHMALLTLRPRVLDYLEVVGEERRFRLEELLVEDGSPLVGRELGEACGEAIPLLLRRATGETLPNPSSREIVQAGDLLLLFGEPKILRPVEGG